MSLPPRLGQLFTLLLQPLSIALKNGNWYGLGSMIGNLIIRCKLAKFVALTTFNVAIDALKLHTLATPAPPTLGTLQL
jgi:hypothetical protein